MTSRRLWTRYLLLFFAVVLLRTTMGALPRVYLMPDGLQYYDNTFYHLDLLFQEMGLPVFLSRDKSECQYMLRIDYDRSPKELRFDAVLYDASGKKELWKYSTIGRPESWYWCARAMIQRLKDEFFRAEKFIHTDATA